MAPEEALCTAEEFLDRCDTEVPTASLEPDVLFALARLLRGRIETSPEEVLSRSADLHQWVSADLASACLFDERDYLLGEFSMIAAKCSRLLGRFSEAERWLDLGDAGYRHTVDPAAALANIAYERLALRFASGRMSEILELLPSVETSFRKLGLKAELSKCGYLRAMTLKETGKPEKAFELLRELERSQTVQENAPLHGQVLIHLADHYVAVGDLDAAAKTYERALPVVVVGGLPVAAAELKWAMGDAYRAQNSLSKALDLYRSASADYERLGSRSFLAKLHLVIADVLLKTGRCREAEWEILAALPVIEEEKMVPEGFAAVALLRESVKARNANVNALRELREYLQAKN